MAREKKFPTFWTIVLLIGIVWFLGDLGILTINVPWLPTVLIVIAIGAIFNQLNN